MAPSRRRSRSPKVVIAVALVVVAAAAAGAALFVATVPALTGATVLGAVAGVAAVALMSAEIVVIRRMWAFDRAKLSDSYRTQAVERHESHLAFVHDLGARLLSREEQIEQMQDALLTSEIDIALAREKLAAEKARSEALQADADAAASDLASAQADLRTAQDALAASEAAGVAARAEIMAWQEASDHSYEPSQRRLA